MRKIAANYIWFPGFELVRNGYVVLESGIVTDVVDTGGVIREIPCLEFYGGMLVADLVCREVEWEAGDRMLDKIGAAYAMREAPWQGLALIQGADFVNFIWTRDSRVALLR